MPTLILFADTIAHLLFNHFSGPVTAGVLRGAKARFQLFGDTVNTAARIEKTGMPNRIHVSESTAHLLMEFGKSIWVHKREDKVHAKGKGTLQTYWLKAGKAQSQTSIMSRSSHHDHSNTSRCDDAAVPWGVSLPRDSQVRTADNVQRLVEWNQEQLLRILKQVVAARRDQVAVKTRSTFRGKSTRDMMGHHHSNNKSKTNTNRMVLDEMTEIITLPKFVAQTSEATDPDSIDLGANVEHQLYLYISFIAHAYRNDNPFHNFAHASHVAMSVNKLLSRIVAPDMEAASASLLHDHTYGITSDPLTQFGIVFSSLIHDADHPGVPNGQLAKEEPILATHYRHKSIAEQNSVDICWDRLMMDDMADLRACIYSTSPDEYTRFRQIVVNSCMATDIFDKELSALRKKRWDLAFADKSDETDDSTAALAMGASSCCDAAVNRKATIVIEHVLQASDVAHTMQHWHVYTTWNERLFQEMYLAYRAGRAEKDPSAGWYKGEIWFFDCYVIPLARKLESCGVFGVSSDEYLTYALANRKEWEEKGEEIVARMVDQCKNGGTIVEEAAATTDPSPEQALGV
jgi:hypothetical protein